MAELRSLDHPRELRPGIGGPEHLQRNLSLHNDVLFSLLTVCQVVIDISGELSARRGERFEDHTQAIETLGNDPRFPAQLVPDLKPLFGFRNVLVHEYVLLDVRWLLPSIYFDSKFGMERRHRAIGIHTSGRAWSRRSYV